MKTLDRKITIVKDGYNEIIDFAEPTLVPDFNSPQFLVQKIITINDDYARRADLVALAVYNDPEKMDIILKFNEISDPLSIKEGDILMIPADQGSDSFYVNPAMERSEVKSNYVDTSKKSKKDTNRLKLLAKISASTKNGSPQNVKTNELLPGKVNIIVEDSSNSIIV